jgi:2-keto-4-pentenoate hydratase
MHFTRIFVAFSAALAIEAADSGALRHVAEDFLAKKPAHGLRTGASFDEAIRAQDEFAKLLTPRLGPVVGYKVGVVTAAGQKRFGVDHPVRGYLLRDMLLPNRSKVPANYGTRPILEPDIVVTVKDDGINRAETMEEAAAHLSDIVAFIELADATFDTNAPFDLGVMVSANVGARLGILGEKRRFETTPDFLAAFGKMALVLKDGGGKELSRVTADGMMGHPMNPLLWFIQDSKKRGLRLKAGDVISLGSPSPQVAPQAGTTYTLIYEGLPGGPLTASVEIQ